MSMTRDIYSRIIQLYDEYNLLEIQKLLNISSYQLLYIKQKYHITNNPKFISPTKTSAISICKTILQKDHGITLEDFNITKNILLDHLYTDSMSPTNIKDYYHIDYTDFGMCLKKVFGIKLRSLSEAAINYNKNIGTYNNKTDKELYYLKCSFRFGLEDFKRVEGFTLIQKYGMYSIPNNLNGVSRDHMVSRYYGWTHNIPSEIISHPANCRIISQRENSSKGENCSITIEELYKRIQNW